MLQSKKIKSSDNGLILEFHSLLKTAGPGWMMSTAYDTALVALLKSTDGEIGNRALAWLREKQLPDGGWGVDKFYYHHDRVISTLAAMTALAKAGNPEDKYRISKACTALETALQGLHLDLAGETVGFELLVPTLVGELEKLGILCDSHFSMNGALDLLKSKRSEKLAKLPAGIINYDVTLAHSAEMAGFDEIQLLDLEKLQQESNGSVANSPSATAYFALHVKPGDPAAMDYLRKTTTMNGGSAPNVAPFDVFERAWILWNFMLATPDLDDKTMSLCRPHIEHLSNAWKPGYGVGFSEEYFVQDSDDTALTYEVLARFGLEKPFKDILAYEEEEWFRCFPLESNPSISANIHVLGALRQAGFPTDVPQAQKIVRFLQRTQINNSYWVDKWHGSPYYPTSHLIITCAGYLNDLVIDSVEWLLETQQENGSWGFFLPTAEETAYCIQALAIWNREWGGKILAEAIKKGAEWLRRNKDELDRPPLWIGKCLYNPVLVTQSAVLSALILSEESTDEPIK